MLTWKQLNRKAFPRPVGNNGMTHYEDHYENDAQDGMTLRQWYIGRALTGMAAANISPSIAAAYAIKYADAVLEALQKEEDDYTRKAMENDKGEDS
jgi:hypothetical protein